MKHYASPSFWKCYEQLPNDIKELADKITYCLNKILNTLHFTLKKLKITILFVSVLNTGH
jgi:hypothetical protein